MIIVTNTIQVKLGCSSAILERFKVAKGVQSFEGFVRLDLLRTEGLTEYEEIKVNTVWESKAHFEAWVASDSFKAAHGHKKKEENKQEGQGHGHGEKADSPIIGSKISYHEIVHTHLPVEASAAVNE
ncbi:antibiotic biosynthesis monooxygenase [Paenibacillus sp. N1-5-1-14]|uniref:antibiotic biosynthesis monooxygenase n=1 Tax=Paenibacillus radicibacter TaxID=2972488 RepID=UPI002159221B|nr:antibiotic biosynthesis monooxygenase [Paenibacillus radicibacter]MCR8643048.1 antibiotic biosynthesis monooxygenase [Paenibacillus radicibacter]